MLTCEKRRWCDDGDLLSRHGGHEGGTQGNFGLTESNVTADEAIHRLAGGQIPECILNGVQLIVGLFVREACRELFIHTIAGHDGVRLFHLPCRCDGHELSGHFENLLLRPCFTGLPACSAQSIDRAFGVFATHSG